MRARGWRRYYWLDLEKLATNLLRRHQRLVATRYFTANLIRDHSDPGKWSRQKTYLEALNARPNLTIHLGYFQPQEVYCYNCGNARQTYEEKMTDVNIAVALLNDAQDNLFDTAMIISADSDLIGPVQALLNRYPTKRVLIAFPPKRTSVNLRDIATAYFVIDQNKLRNSQLPQTVTRPDGFLLQIPSEWA